MSGHCGRLRDCNEKSNRVIAAGQEFLHSFFGSASDFMDERPAETQDRAARSKMDGEILESVHGVPARPSPYRREYVATKPYMMTKFPRNVVVHLSDNATLKVANSDAYWKGPADRLDNANVASSTRRQLLRSNRAPRGSMLMRGSANQPCTRNGNGFGKTADSY